MRVYPVTSQKPNLQRVERRNAVGNFLYTISPQSGIEIRQVEFPNNISVQKLIRTWRAARCAESRDTVWSRGGREATRKTGNFEVGRVGSAEPTGGGGGYNMHPPLNP